MESKLDVLESWKLTAEDLAKDIAVAHQTLTKNNIPKYDSNGDELTLKERINWFLAPTKKKKGKFSDVLTMVVSVYGDGSSEESAQKQARYNLFELISIIRRMKNVWDIVGVDCDFSCKCFKEEKEKDND